MDLVDKKFGDGEVDISIKDKKVILKASYAAGAIGAGVEISVDAHYLLGKLKDLIPGNIDNIVIDILEAQVP